MSHIMLTKLCNLQCPYCFAHEVIRDSNSEITMENFEKAKDFLLTGGNSVGLIGGEPLSHPKILDILDNIIADNRVKNSTVFTNGILLDKVMYKLTNEKFNVLVNVNSEKIMGKERYDRMVANLDMLYNQFSIGHRIGLGFNIHGAEFDYEYIIDLCKRFKRNTLRISICVPNSPEHRDLKSLEWFRIVKPNLFKFFRALYDAKIVPSYDCNYLPICVPEAEDYQVLIDLHKLAKELNVSTNLLSTCSKCSPIIDITPDLKAVRCFGMSSHLTIDIENHKTVHSLVKEFETKIDSFNYVTSSNPECLECTKRITQDCTGGCLAYKDSLIAKARDTVTELSKESVGK